MRPSWVYLTSWVGEKLMILLSTPRISNDASAQHSGCRIKRGVFLCKRWIKRRPVKNLTSFSLQNDVGCAKSCDVSSSCHESFTDNDYELAWPSWPWHYYVIAQHDQRVIIVALDKAQPEALHLSFKTPIHFITLRTIMSTRPPPPRQGMSFTQYYAPGAYVRF